MDTTEIEHELEALLPKLKDGTMTPEEEARFVTLYQRYAHLVEDSVKADVLRHEITS